MKHVQEYRVSCDTAKQDLGLLVGCGMTFLSICKPEEKHERVLQNSSFWADPFSHP